MTDTLSITHEIQTLINQNDVVLFMKGTALLPQCGFSGFVTTVLNNLKVPFKDVNVLERADIRQGIKDFTNWPTIPQLYIKGNFIGGADIVRDMLKSGELVDLMKANDLIKQ